MNEPNPGRRIIFAYESGITSLPARKSTSRRKETLEVQFEFVHLSEFTSDHIKLEETKYKQEKKVLVMPICMAYHGGPLDHPRVTSKSIGEVVQKWDLCHEKLKMEDGKSLLLSTASPSSTKINSDEDVYEKLTGNLSELDLKKQGKISCNYVCIHSSKEKKLFTFLGLALFAN